MAKKSGKKPKAPSLHGVTAALVLTEARVQAYKGPAQTEKQKILKTLGSVKKTIAKLCKSQGASCSQEGQFMQRLRSE